MQKGGLWEKGIYKPNTGTQPLVTIVTVTFNAEKYLLQALQSILDQSYTNVELIVIDGGSTDKTLSIIKSLEDRIDYWQTEPDAGIYDAMNKGLLLARGQWIGFKNADDWYTPNAVELLVHATQSAEGEVYYGNSYSVIQEEPISLSPFFTDHKRLGVNPGIDHRSSFVETDLHKKITFDLKYKLAADLDVFWRLKKAGARFQKINSFMAYKRYGGASDGVTILRETFAINREHGGIFWALFARITVLYQYYSWQAKNLILRTFMGRDGYNRFKARKLNP